MRDDTVVVRTYISDAEAQLDAAVLEANGIPARVSADNAGGAYPSMSGIFPIRLIVLARDAELAKDILDTPVEPADDEAESAE